MRSRPTRLLLLLAVVICLQCRPMARYRGEVQQSLLSVGHSSGGPAPFLDGAEFFDGGVVTLSEAHRTWFSVLSPADVEEIRNIAGDLRFKTLLTTLNDRHFENEYSDYEEIFVYVPGNEEHWGCDIPTVEIPEELQPYLVRIDRVLRRAFGPRYPLKLAERRRAKE